MVTRRSANDPSPHDDVSQPSPAAGAGARGTGRDETVTEVTAQQPCDVTQTAVAAGGGDVTAQSGANGKRKRGRPKGSKNKPKDAANAKPAARKRTRRVSTGSNSRRSLDHEMAQEVAVSSSADVALNTTQSASIPPPSEIQHYVPCSKEVTVPDQLVRFSISEARGDPQLEYSSARQRQLSVITRDLDGPGLGRLSAVDDGGEVRINADMETLEEYMESFDPPVELPATVAEVESIQNMRFDPRLERAAPDNLYRHSDGTTTTRIRPEFKHIFEHSATSCFFAYLPVSFWQQVVGETNAYARLHEITLTKQFSLDEIMTFLGILFYMSLVDKGENANYWGDQVEDSIFEGSSVGLENVMTLRRFKELRAAFCFRCVDATVASTDQAASIQHQQVF
ncbi:unnamed protein product [Phytophthora lilii]|uniref:Unnamed protein product n=1 Tax=Phytophthora lilii TaxID=2077276 RepID=A0A9W6U1D8_9STRA|nr:unnamed protein product [Phytophthora lilii]